ncbi:amino acid transporter [Lentzea atacamensis]|uniref:Amino acid transporter n=1 Tax=Lentzea atacamensis TaxID=531938 RepID=A0ABX9DW65_9PSEU|nr:APC family permease [Lentzea atacamensis]RAS59531.1 amino acid transporter [Lentzea atacamensis]
MSTKPKGTPPDARASAPEVDEAAALVAKNQLSARRIAAFLLASVTLLTVVTGVIPTGFTAAGVTAIPGAFVIVFAMLLVFLPSFFAMGRMIRGTTKAFYAYCATGLSRPVGIGVSFIALGAYAALQVGLYGVFGDVALTTVAPVLPKTVFGATPSPWWFALAAWAFTAWRGRSRLKQNSTVLLAVVVAELAWILPFTIMNFAHPAEGTSIIAAVDDAFVPATPSIMGIAVLICVLAIIGIENPPLYLSKAREPKHRTARRAAYGSVVIMAIIYISSSFSMIITAGPNEVIGASGAGPEMVWSMAEHNIADWFAITGRLLFLGTVLAAMVAFHVTVTFYAQNLGSEGILWSWVGKLSHKTLSPRNASAVMSVIAFAVVVLAWALNWKPTEGLFFIGGTIGAVGVVMMLFLTSLSFIGHFSRSPGNHSLRIRVVAPAISATAMFVVFCLAVWNFGLLINNPESKLGWIVAGLYVLALLGGVGYGLWLRRNAPGRYNKIAEDDTGAEDVAVA